MTTKRLQFFLMPEDEIVLFDNLDSFPWFTLLEDNAGKLQPATRSSSVSKWWISTLPVDPNHLEPNNLPPLIQFLRSRLYPSSLLPSKSELRQGRLAIEYDATNKSVNAAVMQVWRTLKQNTSSNVARINPVAGTVYGKERGVFVGPGAARWAGSGNLLAGNAANVFFSPVAD